MKVSDYIASFLRVQGVEQVYEVVGGMISHLIDSMHTTGGPALVCMHHEQGAAFAADCSGRMSGIPGVAMATSGPGAINLLTGIGNAHFDSSPGIFITGQVNRNEMKGDRDIRQLGFQEAEIISMVAPIVKARWQINDPQSVPDILIQAYTTAVSGRPGPVLLDIPMDVQRAQIDVAPPKKLQSINCNTVDEKLVREALAAMKKASRPLILVGGGLRSGRAADLFRKFVQLAQVPVVNSLMAVDALPSSSRLRIGMIGTYGNRWANMALGETDFLLVVGSRLDVRQTGSDTDSFKMGRKIYHVDCQPGEVNNRIDGCVAIISEVGAFLESAINELRNGDAEMTSAHASWLSTIEANKEKFPDIDELKDVKGINPNVLMHMLSKVSANSAAYIVDVGQHQMWAAQSLEIGEHQRFITSGGMGAMGSALPAAIGACFASGRKPVTMIAGDGSFQLNIQELQTIVRNQLPLKMIVLNNRCHGMVRQFQESYFDSRYQSTMWGYSAPDFVAVTAAYGIKAASVATTDELARSLQAFAKDPQEPYLLEVMVDSTANAYPKLAFGRPITQMEPFAKPIGMEST